MKEWCFFHGALMGALLLAPGAALSASSAWERVEGGAVRIVTAHMAGEDGRLDAALQISLEPGWKTYWRDPGDVGVPPSVTFSAGGEPLASEMFFPAPELFDDGYSAWAGYGGSVSLPLSIELGDADASGILEADVFLGICETICIPVKATLHIPLDASSDASDEAEIASALAALPKQADGSFGATLLHADGESLLVDATVPGPDGEVSLFVAGNGTHMLGQPERLADEDGGIRFAVPVLSAATGAPAEPLHYTLTAPAGSVSGTLGPGH